MHRLTYVFNKKAKLKKQMLETSKSFRKKEGRHYVRTPDVMYCSFSTPKFSVSRKEAQRDALTRLNRFEISYATLRNKTILDLGCNVGAMLFQMSNMGIKKGLGIEYDIDKVEIAKEIAAMSKLDMLTFQQGNIDNLSADTIGKYDIVFALAIEAHVLNRDKLFTLLGAVTTETLYFEGNSNCDAEFIKSMLHNAGFKNIKYLGLCDDDIVPSNNFRPMIKASKL